GPPSAGPRSPPSAHPSPRPPRRKRLWPHLITPRRPVQPPVGERDDRGPPASGAGRTAVGGSRLVRPGYGPTTTNGRQPVASMRITPTTASRPRMPSGLTHAGAAATSVPTTGPTGRE